MSAAAATTAAALILAGGRSSRMGRPKAWLEVAGETMLARTVRILSGVCSPVIVVGAPGQELPPVAAVDSANVPVEIVRDAIEGQGPISGLCTGLKRLAYRGVSGGVAYLSSCDAPLLQPAFASAVIAAIGKADIAIPVEDGFHHPLAAAYRIATVLPETERLLAANRLRPIFLFEHLRVVEIDVEDLRSVDADLDSLSNCNTPEDYARLLARITHAS